MIHVRCLKWFSGRSISNSRRGERKIR